ncbi:MAG: hypothetical protein HY288_10770 [Planctomycetia bacterium]|nr:hypothetical protein [Planctomycetia bacterium]
MNQRMQGSITIALVMALMVMPWLTLARVSPNGIATAKPLKFRRMTNTVVCCESPQTALVAHGDMATDEPLVFLTLLEEEDAISTQDVAAVGVVWPLLLFATSLGHNAAIGRCPPSQQFCVGGSHLRC